METVEDDIMEYHIPKPSVIAGSDHTAPSTMGWQARAEVAESQRNLALAEAVGLREAIIAFRDTENWDNPGPMFRAAENSPLAALAADVLAEARSMCDTYEHPVGYEEQKERVIALKRAVDALRRAEETK